MYDISVLEAGRNVALCSSHRESGMSSLPCRAPNPLGPRQRHENDDCDVIVGLYVDVCESIERLIDLSKKIEEVIITLLWHSLLLLRYDQVVIFVLYIPCLKS